MVTSLDYLVSVAAVAALATAMLVLLAEWLHLRRISRVRFLAFGASGKSRPWVSMAPVVRTLGAACITFGLTVLACMEPAAIEKIPTRQASKHLLVCLDASPSMYVADSGPDGKKKRAVWAGEVIQAILDRLDTETTRVTVFAVYTKSIPVIEETFDMNVVRNLLDGLPLFLHSIQVQPSYQVASTMRSPMLGNGNLVQQPWLWSAMEIPKRKWESAPYPLRLRTRSSLELVTLLDPPWSPDTDRHKIRVHLSR